ncbi:extracellular solute-binding protein [Paenibacillus cremeus]|uniref:Extracellular solute-binding protein n=1 Tax=Paenibacillus cremeus TaxID=2163881 RepID=A0A559K6J9_9BACL|nr:extracellular solute-binding protein [Paenibacillus cremeus]TVY07727.1 extracellular solute-binding protein [Paenibacillus cremeus]
MKPMKPKVKTIIACTSAALLALGAAGCNSTSSSATPQPTKQPEAKSSEPAPAATPAKVDKVTYNIFRSFNAPEYPADGGPAKPIVLDAMDKAGLKGIDYKVTLASGDEYYQKLNLLAASGELPDMFNVNIPTMSRFADEGLIIPLDDLIKDMPNIQKVIKQEDIETLRYKGKLYALPVGFRPEAFNGPNISGFVIRKDWLDSLGLKEPKTLDELHDVLKAFTFNDPDKNGKKDTYGLSTTKMKSNTTEPPNFSAIFGSYGIIPTFWHERGGVLKQGMVLPETKQVLQLLQNWFKEGIIDPDFPIMETKQLQEKVINSKVGVFEGSAFDGDPKQALNSSLLKANPSAKLLVIEPPTGPNGKKGWAESSPSYNDMRAISSKVKDPKRLLQMVDWAVGPGFNLVTYGEEGKDFTFDKDKNKIDMKVESYSELYKKGFSNPIRFLQVVDRRWMADDAIKGMVLSNDPKNLIKNEFWKTTQAMIDHPDLITLWNEYYAKIITGAWSVDKFDEFVQKYYQQGGSDIEKQVNDEWKKTKK